MAVSHFKETVISAAKARGVDLVGSLERVIWEADRELDREHIDLAKAMEMLKKAFGSKLTSDDYGKIEKETRYRLGK